MTHLCKLTLSEALKGLNNKDFTSHELVGQHVERAEHLKDLNAFITLNPEQALGDAKLSDERRAKGEAGLLEGIAIANKDLFCTKDIKTTAASKILENFVPPYESTVTQNLKNAGTISVGKLNLDQFAMGSSNLTSYFGAVINPWKLKDAPHKKLVPGGSSGGSASILAAYGALGVTGTDTGGSIRQPAAFCGVVGLKPTYGRCSRFGVVAFASSLDQAGPMARTVEDAALLLEAMAGYDAKDSTSIDKPVPQYSKVLEDGIRGKRVGIPKEYNVEGLCPSVAKSWEDGIKWLKDAGAEIVHVSLPHTKYALPVYYILAPAEASSNLARYDGVRYTSRVEGGSLDELYTNTRTECFGAEVKRRILMGTYVLSAGYYDAYYLKAQKVRRLILDDFNKVFEDVDFLLTPTTPTAAFAIGEEPKDPVSMYLNDILTVTVNLAGLPAISVPCGLSAEGLPLGLQIIGKSFGEEDLIRAGRVIEKCAKFQGLPFQERY